MVTTTEPRSSNSTHGVGSMVKVRNCLRKWVTQPLLATFSGCVACWSQPSWSQPTWWLRSQRKSWNKKRKTTESNLWCWFVGVWFMNVDKECSVLSTVISAQPWYGDDSPHLPPWIWNRIHHRGVWLPVLATHTSQNSTYDRGPGRTICCNVGWRLYECAFSTMWNTVVVVRVTSLLNK